MGTTERLLRLLSLLQAHRDWPGQELAERLGTTSRTVRRDVDRLRTMGYRIDSAKGRAGGYRLDAGSALPPLLFDDEQAVALAVALRAAAVTGAGVEDAAARALATLRQVMPPRLRHRLDAVDVVTAPTAPRDSALPATLVALSSAVRAREVLRFDYASSRDATVAPPGSSAAHPVVAPRRVEPHHVVAARGRWYLVAWDVDRDDWRVFRADRLTPRTPRGPRFTPREVPGGDVAAFLSARFRGSDRPGAWPCEGTVVLSLPAADVVPFAGDATVEDVGPSRCRVTAGSWSWTALAAHLGRFDADLAVVGPPALADAFSRLAARFTAAATAGTASSRP
ncbi:helix-turn-helix transcriptional regulator [Cellulomonas fimi]|uniref:DeoR family transcriptional regulator n=1 Tax=Cellulomonas fimi (strain ATCC 484 / DSM 20113 / JCM 1341 / CCUG 24087 / LMG 16345 / NBRC 15513 / NCIMB 8980 / NCTC 7547 / NRS-133) TaxID=590998 RepID=F4H356_CELFA|nr:WYL domain-containing protein [Cellulomonas fimi]AEE47674.1 DeoR family transcriptional regulator [Cellulomonas fimi ATCC 484]NNH07429.1 WYL domain-containing protein [Cellulomonas fimi]VEH36769.1 Proteasome accessory factor B [Cellulomonas fimi]